MRFLLPFFILISSPTFADELRFVTWNINGTGFDAREADYARLKHLADPDFVLVQELLSARQTADFMRQAGLAGAQQTSEFSKDSEPNPYFKLEVGIIAVNGTLASCREFDPKVGNDDDTDDIELQAPNFLPQDQRHFTGFRGFLWCENPENDLVLINVHLKSSGGREGAADEKNAFQREAVIGAVVTEIARHSSNNANTSYVVAGDFNAAPQDAKKVGSDLTLRCTQDECEDYDQTHAIAAGDFTDGVAMRNVTTGVGRTYMGNNAFKYIDSPIDNIYVMGPLFDGKRIRAERLEPFGSDHAAVLVSVSD